MNHPEKASRVRGLAGQHSFILNPHKELLTNLRYATAVAWCIYQKAGCSLPAADDIWALGTTWHRHFHRQASGSVKDFVRNYRELALTDRVVA